MAKSPATRSPIIIPKGVPMNDSISADPTAGLWGYADFAAAAGIAEATLRSYKRKGMLPEPTRVVLGRPFWAPAVGADWIANRPGSGNWRSS